MEALSITAALEERVRHAGIDARSMGRSRLEWIVAARCRELGLPDAEAYLHRLEQSTLETDALIESLIVPETRFFRNPAVFDHLRRTLLVLLEASPAPLRLLSAPCSTGQEAYSLAATLVRAGVPPEAFEIDAFDISERALHVAAQGIYPENSMDHVSPADRDACARFHQDQWHVHEHLRERVRFTRRNLAYPDALAGARYQLIFCRNLFIYFHDAARASLSQALAEALDSNGWLVLGPGDLVPELAAKFTPLRPASSFAFRLAALPQTEPRPVPPAVAARQPVTDIAASPEPAPEAPGAAAELHRRALASRSQGNIRLAERRCRQALYVDPEYLPALELLEELWHSSVSKRLRKALAARIHRSRHLAAHRENAAE